MDQIPTELQYMFNTFKGSQGPSNFSTYIPQNTKFDYSQDLSGDRLAGYVKPYQDKNLAHISTGTSSQRDTLATLFHEAAHTVQPGAISSGITGRYSRMSGVPYYDYDPSNSQPPATEVLASLRENEAMGNRNKTIWDSSIGKDYLDAFQTRNPDLNTTGAQRYLDTRMFPEYSVMHTPTDFVQGDQPLIPRGISNLRRLFTK